jgi:hypothetical protein
MGRKINSLDVSIRIKAWVKRSRIVIWLIRFFRARWHNLVLYTRLCQLYGWRMTLRLYRIKLVCRQRGSLVNNRLQTLARRMNAVKKLNRSLFEMAFLSVQGFTQRFPLTRWQFVFKYSRATAYW